MNVQNVDELNTTETVKTGWVLQKGNQYWGLLYPEDRSHGGGPAINGWASNIEHVILADCFEEPPTKGWFTYDDDSHGIQQMSQGEWVRVEVKTTHTLTAL